MKTSLVVSVEPESKPLGQPLHCFDADKIEGGEVVVKTMPEGTPFVTLDE